MTYNNNRDLKKITLYEYAKKHKIPLSEVIKELRKTNIKSPRAGLKIYEEKLDKFFITPTYKSPLEYFQDEDKAKKCLIFLRKAHPNKFNRKMKIKNQIDVVYLEFYNYYFSKGGMHTYNGYEFSLMQVKKIQKLESKNKDISNITPDMTHDEISLLSNCPPKNMRITLEKRINSTWNAYINQSNNSLMYLKYNNLTWTKMNINNINPYVALEEHSKGLSDYIISYLTELTNSNTRTQM